MIQILLEILYISGSPIAMGTIKIWLQFSLHKASIHMPIGNNHLFSPSVSDSVFDIWAAKGLWMTCMKSKSFLPAKFNLPNCNLFHFFQARHFIQRFHHFPNQNLINSHPQPCSKTADIYRLRWNNLWWIPLSKLGSRILVLTFLRPNGRTYLV